MRGKTFVLAVLACLAAGRLEAQISIPYTFTDGTIIRSSEVNGNFTALSSAVNRAGGVMTGALSLAAGTVGAPGLVFSTDAATGWFRPAANIVALGISGAEALRVQAGGYVGIGTTAPTMKLHVVSADADVYVASFLNVTAANDHNFGVWIRAGTTTDTSLQVQNKAGSDLFVVYGSGHVLMSSLPTYADNAAATAGGLAVGKLYRTGTGVMMVRY